MKVIKVPNLRRILKPTWAHKLGYGMSSGGIFVKQDVKEQGTIPNDKYLLKKLGIDKKDKILVIAGYYSSWASAIKKAGADVDYSDISRSIVNYVKKNVKTKFRRYICLNYELIPKKPKEYDWTFTYEACGGRQGLPIAYLRSLINNKGGILVVFTNPENPKSVGGKLESYPDIVKALGQIYKAEYSISKIKIRARRRKDKIFENHPYLICWIKTNDITRQKASLDLRVLDYINNKKVLGLNKDLIRLGISKKELKNSISRLNNISHLIKSEFIKKIILK